MGWATAGKEPPSLFMRWCGWGGGGGGVGGCWGGGEEGVLQPTIVFYANSATILLSLILGGRPSCDGPKTTSFICKEHR